MNILIIGFGSIGRRHFDILKSLKINKVSVVSKQKLLNIESYKSIDDVSLEDYDYFIVANETYLHYETLKTICSKVDKKNILVEKPLFNKREKSIDIKSNNIFVAYNLRFHPLVLKIKELIEDEVVYYANIFVGQYLPTWRTNIDYRECYSSDIDKGGGVLRDLSHELDYSSFLFGNIEKINSINTQISNLEISSDDIYTALAITQNKTILNISMDYISKIPMRRIVVHTENKTIEADFIKATLKVKDMNDEKQIVYSDIDANYTYTNMHKSILDSNKGFLCSYEEGLKVVEVIAQTRFKDINSYEKI